MAAPRLPDGSDTFLKDFGTPTLLWRVLSSVGYDEAPHYTWESHPPIGDVPWFDVTLDVPPHPSRSQWHGWNTIADRHTLFEAAQDVALHVLMEISQ
jgi:hypothetical protein